MTDCVKQKTNKKNAKLNCRVNIFRNEQTCIFLVKKVRYDFYHNGTQGLTEVNLFLNTTNVTYFLTDHFEIIQFFEVKFFWYNFKHNLTGIFSGNPGYLLGKPILFGELNDTTSYTNKTENKENFQIVKDDCNIFKNNLVLPKNDKHFCALSNISFTSIEFGYNTRISCIQKIIFNSSKNATDICIEFQKRIFEKWQIYSYKNDSSSSKKYIGMFGNANRLDISDWIEILYKFDTKNILDHITGINQNNKIECKNIAHTLKINIIYANIDFEFSKHQSKILNVFYELEKSLENSFIDLPNEINNKNIVAINLFMDVMFFDITKEKVKKFVPPPSLHLSLPHDFFYPFIMNRENRCTFNFIMLVCTICIIIMHK